MLNQGIPAFRLPREIVDREIRQVAATGVIICCGSKSYRRHAGRLSEDFDAVVLAAGTLRPNILELPARN